MRYLTGMAALMLMTVLTGCKYHGGHGPHCKECAPHGGHGFGAHAFGAQGHAGHAPGGQGSLSYGGRACPPLPCDHHKQGLIGNPPPPFYNLPPAQMLLEPGPGVGGPGPGVMGVVPASYDHVQQVSQVRFIGPPAAGGGAMRVHWQVAHDTFSDPLITPANMDFNQGAIYRLKLTHIPGLEDVQLYPTLEMGPSTPRTEAFLAHNKVPIQFTPQDFAQVLSGNFVTKVIYLPDPEHQQLAVAGGVDELVSSRLDPGIDPVSEADRKGTILAIIRLGNKDLEAAGPGGAGRRIKAMGFQEEVEGQAPPMSGAPVPEYGQPSLTPSFISGVTTVPYGMPYTGTPIGLPGPPHLPLGVPAGLKRHAINNHTQYHIPQPTHNMNIHVKQEPGYHYPQPPNTMYIHERVQPGGGMPHPVVPMPADHSGGIVPNFAPPQPRHHRR